MERELKEKDDKEEVFVGEVGETDFPESGKKKKIIRIVILIVILLVLVGIGVTLFFLLRGDKKEDKKEKATILMDDSKFKKPKTLTKKYELVELKDSKYKFILVHDPITLNGGIEIRTKYGFNTGPIDGFAHYAEHIFFHGTKDIHEIDIFSIIGQFDEFVNAYTWIEETVFQYFGSNYTFDTVLYYISEFIKHPQLNESKYMTEINAVNSEYDSYNYSQSIVADILIDNANPEHPFSQSITGHTGNNDTLHSVNSTELGELLKNYFRTIFKPENCIFVLYSSKSFSEMIDYADKYFNFKLEEPTEEFTEKFNQKVKALDNPIFKKDQLGKIATYNSISEIPLMLFIFPISQKENNYIEVTYILYYLFDNTEEGSFKKYLLDNNYISEGSSGYYGYFKKYEMVEFDFYLTKDGFKNIDKIIEALFASINVIKEDKNLDEKLNNFKLIEEKAFYFKEETSSAFPDDIDFDAYNGFRNRLMVKGYPEDMIVMFSYVDEDSGIREGINGVFPMFDSSVSGVNYLFLPLHFKDRSIGYFVIRNAVYLMKQQFLFEIMNSLITGIEQLYSRTMLAKMNSALAMLYNHDSLTSLYNRFGYNYYASRFYEDAKKQGRNVAVIYYDLDRLKFLNDNYGHDVGDKAIKIVAGLINKYSSNQSLGFRLGGDEFLLLDYEGDEQLIIKYIAGLRDELSIISKRENMPIELSVSAGYVICDPDSDMNIDTYVNLADDKMYEDKVSRKMNRRD